MLRLLALLPLLFAAAGCRSLADHIVAPPATPTGIDVRTQKQMEDHLGVQRRRWERADGPSLAYRIVAPARYGMEYRYRRTEDGLKFNFTLPNPAPQPLPARGSVVYLHGWGLDGTAMLPWAIALAEQGLVGIVVDLRNHGSSAPGPAGYGPREGEDVAALVQALRRDGEIVGPVQLLGVSYGAVAAIFAARHLQDAEIQVVALEPFANAAEGIRGVVSNALDSSGGGLKSRLFRAFARHRYDPAGVDADLTEAGRRLGLDLAAIDVRAALASLPGCTLILHGADDDHIPVASVRSLAHGVPRVQLVELQGENHFTLPARVDLLAQPIGEWMLQPRPEACAGFSLPTG